MSNFQPSSFAEAKEAFRPLKRSRMKNPTQPMARSKKKRPTAPGGSVRGKRKKKLTTGQLKKKVWKEFSIYIRTRDANSEGYVKCFTCMDKLHWKETQAGHFIRGRLNANLFAEKGCHAQCHRCNIHFQGNVVVYYKKMLAKYGQEVIDELIEQNNQTRKWQAGELESLLEHYKGLNAINPLLKG